jgi:2-methylisocitrate lyase-like PEP mutase family enzyme
MTRPVAEKRAMFRTLHQKGCFVLPNPWDAGSARLLQSLGFAALASTSSGYAWTLGRPDYGASRDDVLQHLAALCKAVDVPLNADFESGFAADLEGLSVNVGLAVRTGVAGLSIEDRDVTAPLALYDTAFAVERIRTAREAIRASGEDVMLVARTEGLLSQPQSVGAAIDRLVAFAAAGADCLYAPGVKGKADIQAMVRAVAPKPLNVLVLEPGRSVAEFADWGVRRISVGGGLAKVAWGGLLAAAKQMQEGSFAGLSGGVSGDRLDDIFGGFV